MFLLIATCLAAALTSVHGRRTRNHVLRQGQKSLYPPPSAPSGSATELFNGDLESYDSADGSASIRAGQCLRSGEHLIKDVGKLRSGRKGNADHRSVWFTRYELRMQDDCNAVLYEHKAFGTADDKYFEHDEQGQISPNYDQKEAINGYNRGLRRTVWSSGTDEQGAGCQLVLPEAGDAPKYSLAVVAGNGTIVWSSDAELQSFEISPCLNKEDPRILATGPDGSQVDAVLPEIEGWKPYGCDKKFKHNDDYLGRGENCRYIG